MINIFRTPVVELKTRLTVGEFVLHVCLAEDEASGVQAAKLAEQSFEVLLPVVAQQIQYHPSMDTLFAVLDAASGRESGAHLRFGDGDLGLIIGSTDQMQQVLELPEMYYFWHITGLF